MNKKTFVSLVAVSAGALLLSAQEPVLNIYDIPLKEQQILELSKNI